MGKPHWSLVFYSKHDTGDYKPNVSHVCRAFMNTEQVLTKRDEVRAGLEERGGQQLELKHTAQTSESL